uniref:Uncharacterized protein n=1 Tax=Cacopsylla melanoneura TaxID=428564 RepID=A0A8D8W0C8_9HEMI
MVGYCNTYIKYIIIFIVGYRTDIILCMLIFINTASYQSHLNASFFPLTYVCFGQLRECRVSLLFDDRVSHPNDMCTEFVGKRFESVGKTDFTSVQQRKNRIFHIC